MFYQTHCCTYSTVFYETQLLALCFKHAANRPTPGLQQPGHCSQPSMLTAQSVPPPLVPCHPDPDGSLYDDDTQQSTNQAWQQYLGENTMLQLHVVTACLSTRKPQTVIVCNKCIMHSKHVTHHSTEFVPAAALIDGQH